MKIQPLPFQRSRTGREGSAVIVMLALLATMVLLVAANTKTVNWLRAEVKLVDQHQTARLAASATNQVSITQQIISQ